MAWVRGIREVHYVEEVVHEARRAVTGRIPGVARERRVIVDLPADAIARVIGRRLHWLASNTGAGPCGTYARRAPSGSPMRWSIAHLVEPLVHYYATYEPPLRFGAKSTPRGRRAA